MVWRYIAAAVGLAAVAALVTFYVLGVSPIPVWLEGGNPRPLGSRPARMGDPAAINDYTILQKGFLLETGATVMLAKKDIPLTKGSVVSLINCIDKDCTIQKLLQEESVLQAVASNRFDQFAFIAGPKAELYYINTDDKVLAHGRLDLQCARKTDGGEGVLKSVGNRTVYVEFSGEDCLTAKFKKTEFALTTIELKQPTTDTIKVKFGPNAAILSVDLEIGADAQGHRLK
jgi:hypothetical protein